jgi:hypothetical protein
VERKEHILDERDALFADLRHKHFAAASIAISSLMDDFRSKNKVGKAGSRGGGAGEMELRNMSKLIQSLPQYRWAGWKGLRAVADVVKNLAAACTWPRSSPAPAGLPAF